MASEQLTTKIERNSPELRWLGTINLENKSPGSPSPRQAVRIGDSPRGDGPGDSFSTDGVDAASSSTFEHTATPSARPTHLAQMATACPGLGLRLCEGGELRSCREVIRATS